MNCQKFSIRCSSSSLKCAICRRDIKNNSSVYQSSSDFSIVCERCYVAFSKEDIDLVLLLFRAYGGFFGKNKKEDFKSKRAIKAIREKLYEEEGAFNMEEFNKRLLHMTLIHGIFPGEYHEILKELLKEKENHDYLNYFL